MERLIRVWKGIFISKGQPNVGWLIRLQSLDHSLSNIHSATPDDVVIDGDDLEPGARLSRSKRSLPMLGSLVRLFKVIESAWDSRFPGWRSGMAGFTILASIVLILNVSALIWAATHQDDGSYATLTSGSYENISDLSEKVHFGINVLSAIVLAGSNYCIQCLTSPTRAEVDIAHERGSYLNIGIPSWRNVMVFRKRRICLLLIVTVTSVIMPAVYDTSVLMKTAIQSYTSAIVTPDLEFLPYNFWAHEKISTPSVSYTGEDITERKRYIQNITTTNETRDSSLWQNISAKECAKYNILQTDRSTLLVVMDQTVEQLFSNQDPRQVPYGSSHYSAILTGFLRHRLFPQYSTTEKDWATTSQWHTNISYCLSRKATGRNRLQIHVRLLLTAVVLNTINLGCYLYTFKEQKGTPLVTTGDAISSFLSSHCKYSVGMCLLSENEVVRTLEKRRDGEEVDEISTSKQFTSTRMRYYHSISLTRWILYVGLFLLITAFSVSRFIAIHKHHKSARTGYNLYDLWKIGVGKLNEHSLSETTLCDYKSSLVRDNKKWVDCRITHAGISAMILANLSQIPLSALYFCLNHQLTKMVQLRDWTRLASRRQPIRVTDPEPGSNQISTYWLSLPYRYSVPLLLAWLPLGRLMSQALFIVHFAVYDDIDTIAIDRDRYLLGFSAIALVYAFILLLLIFGVSIAIAFCNCTPGMPLGPSNSLVIAAACYPPEEDRHAARKLVKWGAIPVIDNNEATLATDNAENVDSPQHCAITSGRVEDPVEGRWYE